MILPIINEKHKDLINYPLVSQKINQNICFFPECYNLQIADPNFHLCNEHLPNVYNPSRNLLEDLLFQQIHLHKLIKKQIKIKIKQEKIEQDFTHLNNIQNLIDEYLHERYGQPLKGSNDKFKLIKVNILEKHTNHIYFETQGAEGAPEGGVEKFMLEIEPPFLFDPKAPKANTYIKCIVLDLLIYYNTTHKVLQIYRLKSVEPFEIDYEHIIYETNDKIIYINQLSKDNYRKQLLKEFGIFTPEGGYSDDIKKQWKKLALTYHPDKNGGNSENFKKYNEIYNLLTNQDSFDDKYEICNVNVYMIQKDRSIDNDINIKASINDQKNKLQYQKIINIINTAFKTKRDIVFALPLLKMQLEHYEQIEDSSIQELFEIKDEFILNKYLIGDHTSPWWEKNVWNPLHRKQCTTYGDGFLNCAIEYFDNVNSPWGHLFNRLERCPWDESPEFTTGTDTDDY